MQLELLHAFQEEITKKHGADYCKNFKEVNSFDLNAGQVFDLPPFENFKASESFYIKYQILDTGLVLYQITVDKPPTDTEYYTPKPQLR